MTILFLHGWQSVPGGVKPTYLKDHGHTVINPKLPDEDFDEAVRIAQAEFDQHQPDVVVGSSRGGAVAMNIESGDARLVLLCPAWKRWGTATTVKKNTVILHSRSDDVISFAESEGLANVSGATLIEVGSDHRLADPESLKMTLRICNVQEFQDQTTVGQIAIFRSYSENPQSMQTHEITEIICPLLNRFPEIVRAINERVPEAFASSSNLSHFSFPVPQSVMTPQVYDSFRTSDFFIVSVPDRYFGEGMARATIRKKQFVVPSPSMCFHATPVTNKQSVEEKGLLPGVVLGRSGRHMMFADSPFYIFASLSEEEAREWCERFADEDYLIYPIRLDMAGVRLFVDPCSVDTANETVSGFILDSIHVAPGFLDPPIEVRRPRGESSILD